MKISLLRTLVAAFALCMAVPGQAAMAGDVGSGGEPGVQQEDAGVVFTSTPSATTYASWYNNEGTARLYFYLEGMASDMSVRVQLADASNSAGIRISATEVSSNTQVELPLDSDGGVWLSPDYVNYDGLGGGRIAVQLISTMMTTIECTVSVYPMADLSSTALATWAGTVRYIDGYPTLDMPTRISGALDTDVALDLTVNGRGLVGEAALLRISPSYFQEGEDAFTISGEGITEDAEGNFICNIASLSTAKTYHFIVRASTTCKGSVYAYLSDAEGNVVTSRSVNIQIPMTFDENDVNALKAMADANPMSMALRDFIDKEYYKNDWSYSDNYNVGVVWNTDDPSRVSEFYLEDYDQDVTSLDFSPLTELQRIEIRNSGLKELNLSALPNLYSLSLYSTDLTWKDVVLPQRSVSCSGSTYIVAKGATNTSKYNAYAKEGAEIDLSEYAVINGVESSFQWYETTNGAHIPVNLYNTDKLGAFILTGAEGSTVYCQISNSSYAGWDMRTPEIKIARSSEAYYPADVEGLKKIAADNPDVPQLQDFVDSEGWINENWGVYEDAIRTDWKRVGDYYRLTHLYFEMDLGNEPDTISVLDLSPFTELEYFECERFLNISELDLSNNMKLQHLHIYSRNLESIDLSNHTNLREFSFRTTRTLETSEYEYPRTKLHEINLSGCINLEVLEVEHAHIRSLDLSQSKVLRELRIEGCLDLAANTLDNMPSSVTKLSLPQTTQFGDYIQQLSNSITHLNLVQTPYELPNESILNQLNFLGIPYTVDTFDFALCPKLTEFNLGFTLPYSELKYSSLKNYRSTINSKNDVSRTKVNLLSNHEPTDLFENGDTIDLSSEAVINGIESVLIWVNVQYRTEETEVFVPVPDRPGVFVVDASKSRGDGRYYCKIMNPLFCNITEINVFSGWQMETNYISVTTEQISEYYEGDVQVIARIVSDSNNDALTEWWNSNAWQTGENTNVAQAVWNNEEPRRLTELYLYSMFNGFAESVDLRSLDKLEILSLAYNNSLKEVILPENTNTLRSLMLLGTGIETLIVSPYTALEYLDVSNTELTALDLSNNTNLTELKLNGTQLEPIEMTNPALAARLVTYGVPEATETIDLAAFPALKQLYPNNSKLRFSGVQNPRQMDPINANLTTAVGTTREGCSAYGSTLDFATEMNIGGVTSTISWQSINALTGETTAIDAADTYTISEELTAGDYVVASIQNTLFPGWTMNFQTEVYTRDGDANLDKLVNVADVTATVSYILKDQENMIDRFGYYEADVNYDNYVEVADVIGIVNIIQGKPVTKASELRDAYQPTVLLELDDKGFLSMTSQVPVAGIQLEFTGATMEIPLLSDAAHLVQASTLNGDTLRTLGYSMDGKTIPAGKTVIMQLPAGVKLLKAVFSDAEANSLKAEGDIVPTGIESIQTADQIEAVLNYPNPFSGSTTFSYVLKEQAQSVAIQIFSTSGALVETIEGLPASVGTNRYTTSVQLPGGIYYYRLLLDGKKASEANTMMIK